MKFLTVVSIVLELVFLPCVVGSEAGDPLNGNVISGVIFHEDNSTILYDETFKISFLLNLPIISPRANNTNCTAHEVFCQLLNQVKSVQHLIDSDLVEANPYWGTDSSINRNRRGVLDFVGEIDHQLFGIATDRELAELHADLKKLVKHESELEAAVKGNQNYSNALSQNLTTFVQQWDDAVNLEMGKLHLEIRHSSVIFSKDLATLGEMVKVLNQNQYILFTLNRLEMLAIDCRSQLIPRSVISDRILSAKIEALNAIIKVKGYETFVSLNSLLKLRIADCIFGNDKVKVSINVPVRKIGSNYRAFRVIAVPFQSKHEQCLVHQPSKVVLTSSHGVHDLTGLEIDHCSLGTSKLCQVPGPLETPSSFSICVQTVLLGDENKIRQDCVLECRRSNSTRITRLPKNEIVVTNPTSLRIVCENSTGTTSNQMTTSPKYGAIHFKLNCNCSATINLNIKLQPDRSCEFSNMQVNLTTIVPSHFTSTSAIIFEGGSLRYNNLTEIVNEEWHMNLPVFNSTPSKPFTFSNDYQNITFSSQQQDRDAVQTLWTLLLTVYVIGLTIYIILQKRQATAGGIPISLLLAICTCSAETGDPSFGDAFWLFMRSIEYTSVILFVCGGIILLFLSFTTCKIYRNSKATYQLLKTIAISRSDDV